MRYGSLEFAHAEPFADALVNDDAFRAWVLSQTKFSAVARGTKLLDQEMKLARSKKAENWWRSHYTGRCRCEGCSGQETGLLAVFEANSGTRFALHFEIKQPTDKFPSGKNQAKNYAIRARCWVEPAPKAVLAHSEADTVLLCSASKLNEYATHLPDFGAIITFEEVGERFPRAVAASTSIKSLT